MLRIYNVALEVVPVVIGLADAIAAKDRDQAAAAAPVDDERGE